jgi:hypothetical protein
VTAPAAARSSRAGVATRPRPAVSVDELRRAWAAIQAGDFRHRPPCSAHRRAWPTGEQPHDNIAARWEPAPGERVLPVLGAAGSIGATTVALALATVAAASGGCPTRVVECAPATASGLAAASTAELGVREAGWRQGRRDQVLLERTSAALTTVDEVPLPLPAPATMTVLDVGWPVGQVLGTWLGVAVTSAETVVVVAAPTVPGLRRLDAAVEMLGADRAVAAVVGPRPTRWSKSVRHSAGASVRQLLAEDRVAAIPHVPALAVAGVDSAPLPAPLLRAASRLLAHVPDPTPGVPADA